MNDEEHHIIACRRTLLTRFGTTLEMTTYIPAKHMASHRGVAETQINEYRRHQVSSFQFISRYSAEIWVLILCYHNLIQTLVRHHVHPPWVRPLQILRISIDIKSYLINTPKKQVGIVPRSISQISLNDSIPPDQYFK